MRNLEYSPFRETHYPGHRPLIVESFSPHRVFAADEEIPSIKKGTRAEKLRFESGQNQDPAKAF